VNVLLLWKLYYQCLTETRKLQATDKIGSILKLAHNVQRLE